MTEMCKSQKEISFCLSPHCSATIYTELTWQFGQVYTILKFHQCSSAWLCRFLTLLNVRSAACKGTGRIFRETFKTILWRVTKQFQPLSENVITRPSSANLRNRVAFEKNKWKSCRAFLLVLPIKWVEQWWHNFINGFYPSLFPFVEKIIHWKRLPAVHKQEFNAFKSRVGWDRHLQVTKANNSYLLSDMKETNFVVLRASFSTCVASTSLCRKTMTHNLTRKYTKSRTVSSQPEWRAVVGLCMCS